MKRKVRKSDVSPEEWESLNRAPKLIDGTDESAIIYKETREARLKQRKEIDKHTLKSFFYSTLKEVPVEKLIERHDDFVYDNYNPPEGVEGISFYRDIIRWRIEMERDQKIERMTRQVTILTWIVTLVSITSTLSQRI